MSDTGSSCTAAEHGQKCMQNMNRRMKAHAQRYSSNQMMSTSVTIIAHRAYMQSVLLTMACEYAKQQPGMHIDVPAS